MNLVIPLSFVGVSASLFLGVLFLLKGRQKVPANLLLGVFFLLVAIRLGKLAVQTYAPEIVINAYFNLMHAAFLAIGPVILIYVRTYGSGTHMFGRKQLLHFFPSASFLLGSFHGRSALGEELWLWLYGMTLLHPLFYACWSGVILWRHSHSMNLATSQKAWLVSLTGGVVLISGMNILYFLFGFPFYVVTAVLLLMTVYLIAFITFSQRGNMFIGQRELKYRNQNLPPKEISRFWNETNRLLIDQKLHLRQQVTLSDIAQELQIPVHVVSRVINEKAGRTFPDYINHLRIQSAQTKLIEEPGMKVISVALECGFHSLSAFNRAFKKHAGLSPSLYRIRHSLGKNT